MAKFSEMTGKAEQLVESGNAAKKEVQSCTARVSAASAQLKSAQRNLDSARESDEDGKPKGNVSSAQSAVAVAQGKLAASRRALQDAKNKVAQIDAQKKTQIRKIESHNSIEKNNLTQLKKLQGMTFAGNAEKLYAGIAERINQAEKAKASLEQSLGIEEDVDEVSVNESFSDSDYVNDINLGKYSNEGLSSRQADITGTSEINDSYISLPNASFGYGMHNGAAFIDGLSINSKEGYSFYLTDSKLVERVDFGNLDINTARDITFAIRETMEEFPELELRFVGSLQSRNDTLRQQLTDMYMQYYKQYNPEVPEDQLTVAVQRQVIEDMRGFEPDYGTIAESLFVGDVNSYSDSIFSAYNGITINEAYGGNYEHFIKTRKTDVDSGWKPENCFSPKATVDHELGHQIAKLVNAHKDDFIVEKYNEFMAMNENDRPSVLSGYAGKNIHEFIAEAWSEYKNNPKCRECAMSVAKRIEELYKEGNGEKKLVKTLRR